MAPTIPDVDEPGPEMDTEEHLEENRWNQEIWRLVRNVHFTVHLELRSLEEGLEGDVVGQKSSSEWNDRIERLEENWGSFRPKVFEEVLTYSSLPSVLSDKVYKCKLHDTATTIQLR